MALQKFLVDFDLNGNQIKNAVLGTVAGTTPGAIWFDSSSKEVKYVDETGSVKVVVPTTVTDSLASDIASVVADLSSEVSRATGVEAGLASDISDVVADLTTESSARVAGDNALDARLDTVENTLAVLDVTYATEVEVDAAVAVETSAREAAVAGVQSDVDGVSSDLSSEVSRALAAEGVLSSAISAETSNRVDGDAAIASDLADEVARAEAAEGVLDGRLDTVESTIAALDSTYATDAQVTAAIAVETAARTAGGAAIGVTLTNLNNARLAGEAALDGRLDTVESTLANLDATYATEVEVAAAVAVETSAREVAVAGVQSDVDGVASDLSTEVAARSAADMGLAQDIADETSARETAVGNVASDLSDETSRATAAEAGLASDISGVVADLSSEVSRATAAEVSLDGRLDTVEGTLAALDATYATDAQVTSAIAVETAARLAAAAAGATNIQAAFAGVTAARIAGDEALDARLDVIEANHPRKFAVAVGNGSATSFTVTHNLGTSDVVVSVRDASSNAVVVAAVTHSTDNTVTVEVNGSAPANNALKVVVIG